MSELAFYRMLIAAILSAMLISCSAAPSSITPHECLAIAESYRTHRWYAEPRHIRHGVDKAGIRIDTPDVNYQPSQGLRGWWRPQYFNIGVPYKWGGFDSLAEFDAKLIAGAAAGDVYTLAKRRLLDAGVTQEAAGVDCSGFISRCWKLPQPYSTRSLPGLCIPIKNWSEAQAGDIFNTYNAHVMLFVRWADHQRRHAIVYETGRPPAWKVVRHQVKTTWLQAQGYSLWRYRGMR